MADADPNIVAAAPVARLPAAAQVAGSPSSARAPTPAAGHWLSVVGIGEDGVDGLSNLARDLIQSAQIVFGGARHLSLAGPLIRGTARTWRTPIDASVADIIAERGRQVCVLASGDPFQHGIGSVLARHIGPDETISVPALSAFALAASRLLWPLQDTTLLSLCGRSLDFLRPHLHPGVRILTFTSGVSAPAKIAELLRTAGFGQSRVTVLEALGGPHERIRSSFAAGFMLDETGALNTVAIEVVADATARILPRAPGLADELFEHDGQITKREIRALTLSALAPRRGDHLWDVGGGSGSVAIEWMLADPSLSAITIECRADRAARIRRNAGAFGVPNLEVIEGKAPDALRGLRTPDAVFIGGGATTPGVIEDAQRALRTNGRLVINAVTLDTEAALMRAHAEYGGTLTRIDIQRAGPIGTAGAGAVDEARGDPIADTPARRGEIAAHRVWQPARPITQWAWTKP